MYLLEQQRKQEGFYGDQHAPGGAARTRQAMLGPMQLPEEKLMTWAREEGLREPEILVAMKQFKDTLRASGVVKSCESRPSHCVCLRCSSVRPAYTPSDDGY